MLGRAGGGGLSHDKCSYFQKRNLVALCSWVDCRGWRWRRQRKPFQKSGHVAREHGQDTDSRCGKKTVGDRRLGAMAVSKIPEMF